MYSFPLLPLRELLKFIALEPINRGPTQLFCKVNSQIMVKLHSNPNFPFSLLQYYFPTNCINKRTMENNTITSNIAFALCPFKKLCKLHDWRIENSFIYFVARNFFAVN